MVPMLAPQGLELRVRQRAKFGEVCPDGWPLCAVPELVELQVVPRNRVKARQALLADQLVIFVLRAALVLAEIRHRVESDNHVRPEQPDLCRQPQPQLVAGAAV